MNDNTKALKTKSELASDTLDKSNNTEKNTA